MINERAGSDARHARTGKDGAFYDGDGNLLATVESFTSKSSWNNSKYSVLGDAQEHETANTFSVTLTFTQVVIEDDQFIVDLLNAMENQTMPNWVFQGTLQGRNGTEERMVYKECIPSGDIDLQNIAVGDVIKRAWNMFCNAVPKLQNQLTID